MANLEDDLSGLSVADGAEDEASLFAALEQQEAQRRQLLDSLDASPLSAPPSQNARNGDTIESSAPDDDLVPPHYSISADPSVRNASVELLHCITALKTWQHVHETVEDMRAEWEEMLAELWDFPEAIVSTADVKLERVDPVSEEERRAVNEEVAGFVEAQRLAAVKTSTEEVRTRICKLARLETQVAIGSVVGCPLLRLRAVCTYCAPPQLLALGIAPQPGDADASAADEEQETARAARLLVFHIRDDITQRQKAQASTVSATDLELVDIHGRLRWDKLRLAPVKRPE